MRPDEHLAFLIKREVGARAERLGFHAAEVFTRCPPYSKDPYEQMRYEQGYEDGRAMRAATSVEDGFTA